MNKFDVRALARGAVADNALTRPDWRKPHGRDSEKIWLDKNENTDPILNRVVQEVFCNVSDHALYGYPDTSFLYGKLSSYLGVKPDNLMLSHGSDGVIRLVFEAFVNPGDNVLCTNPTFAMYEIYSKMYGAKYNKVNYRLSELGPVLTAEELIDSIKYHGPKLVCLPNPDSPTGTIFPSKQLRQIINIMRDIGGLILIDEAYYPFSEITAASWIEEFPNLIIARTFAKAWGLAGLRIGYSMAAYETTALLHKVRPMYEVNSVAVEVVEKMLSRAEEMKASVVRLKMGMRYFLQEMRNLGFRAIETHGNFGLVSFGGQEGAIHERLKHSVLYRRNFLHPSLDGYSRFSAAPENVMKKVVNLICGESV